MWSPGMQSALYSATFYGSLITIFFSGYLADRYGPKYLIFFAISDYIIVTLLTPVLAEFNYYAFFIARIIMGLGEVEEITFYLIVQLKEFCFRDETI